MTLIDILTRELAETKHYEVYTSYNKGSTIGCKHGFRLCVINHDNITYENRHGNAIVYAADPHFFDKLRKLLAELCKRRQRCDLAFEKKLRGQR